MAAPRRLNGPAVACGGSATALAAEQRLDAPSESSPSSASLSLPELSSSSSASGGAGPSSCDACGRPRDTHF